MVIPNKARSAKPLVPWTAAFILLMASYSMRDRDVRNAIQAILLGTNAFDAVWLGGAPDACLESVSNNCSAAIEPEASEFTPSWDSGVIGGVIVTSKLQLTFAARHADPQLRDELAELLLSTASNALNGQQLGGLVIPQMTRFVSWTWQEARPPERKIKTVFAYQYLEASWNGLDVSP